MTSTLRFSKFLSNSKLFANVDCTRKTLKKK